MGNLWSASGGREIVADEAGSSGSTAQEDGATLMEFAVVFPFLVLLLIGILEFGWVLSQYLDVRHGAREGVRLATVNYPEGASPPSMIRTQANTSTLLAETCSRMNVSFRPTVVFDTAGTLGDPVTVTVKAPSDTLTGFLDWALPSNDIISTAILHAEQEPTWANTDLATFPSGQPCP